MKLLVIDCGRSEFFWGPVVEELRRRCFNVTLAKGMPIDVSRYDAVLHVYLDQGLKELSRATTDIPIFAFNMGTDVINRAYQGVNWQRVKRVLMVNRKHMELLHMDAPETMNKTALVGWFLDEKRLTVDPVLPLNDNETIRLVNSAWHGYSKGLDNLLQMLVSLPEDLRRRLELHILGDLMDQYLQYFCAMMRDRADFNIIAHGGIAPQEVNAVLNSIKPHATIAASQGEASGTTIMESLYKGIPAIVQEHPFAVTYSGYSDGRRVRSIDGFFDEDAPILWYLTQGELQKALESLTDALRGHELHQYAADRWTLGAFTDKLVKIIKGDDDDNGIRG